MRAKKRKPRRLGNLQRIDRTHHRWPRGMKTPDCITHAYTDWNVIVLVSEFEVEPFGLVTHLWIRDMASSTHWPWYFLQTIKDLVCGAECQAIEIFPRESDLVDAANMRHLWVFEEYYTLPFGIHPGVPA